MRKLLFFMLLPVAFLYSCQQDGQAPAEAAAADKPLPTEPHRPAYHFTPETNWMNDPNGMVFYEGEYHLFFQYYPDSTVWGPMHWGHAVSKDLVHWEELPIALYPDSLGYVFSGSAVVDWKNTSGFGKNGQPPLVAIFTYHDMAAEKAGRTDYQSQAIAYSNDRGRTWTKYSGNPVLPNPGIKDIRDPKVIWDADRNRWVMVLAVGDHVSFYQSPDLKQWTFLSDFGKDKGAHGGVWECPDLFPMTIAGTNDVRWVLLVSLNPGGPNGGSATQYFVGFFDGEKFALDYDFTRRLDAGEAVWIDWGRDNYAGVTWSDVPPQDGRRLFIGWMSNWDYATVTPTQRWRSAMTVPRELVLQRTLQGLRLFTSPAKELEKMRRQQYEWKDVRVEGELNMGEKLTFSPTVAEIVLEGEWPVDGAMDFGFEWSNAKGQKYRLGYDPVRRIAYSDRTRSGKVDFDPDFAAGRHTAMGAMKGNAIQWRIYIDRASCELFANEGASCMTNVFFPEEDFSQLRFYAQGGAINIKRMTVYELRQ